MLTDHSRDTWWHPRPVGILFLVLLLPFCAGARRLMLPLTPDALVLNGTAMVPLRPLAELLDATITVTAGIDAHTTTVTVARDAATFVCREYGTDATINGRKVQLPRETCLRSDVLYVPLRAFATALKGSLTADSAHHQITVTFPRLPNPLQFHTIDQNDMWWYASGSQIYSLRFDGSGLHRLTYHEGENTLPVCSPDDRFVAFGRDDGLYLQTTGSSNVICLLPVKSNSYSYSSNHLYPIVPAGFTHDGQYLLYEKEVASQQRQICRIHPDGSGNEVLSEGEEPCLSPDGTQIAFVRRFGEAANLSWDVYMNQLTRLPDGIDTETLPADTVLYLMDAEGKNAQRIGVGIAPSFSRDGSRLLYSRPLFVKAGEPPRYLLVSQMLSGPQAGATTIADSRQQVVDQFRGRFSPDGEQIVYDGAGISQMPVDQSRASDLTFDDDTQPRFTPDGKTILFLRRGDLYAMAPDGSGVKSLTHDALIQRYAVMPDSDTILYQTTSSSAAQRSVNTLTAPFTENDVQAMLPKIIPLVEQAAGRKFTTIPICKVVSPDEFATIAARDDLAQDRKVLQSLTPLMVKNLAEDSALREAHFAMGVTMPRTLTIYLIPDNFFDRLRRSGIDPKEAINVMPLVLAHELTHVLQEQVTGILNRSRSCDDRDAAEATDAAIEGHAMFIGERVAIMLHQDKLNADLDKYYPQVSAPTAPMRELELISWTDSKETLSDTYLGGRDFMAWHFRAGNNERLWQILANQPMRMSMIYHPETYAPSSVDTVDYAAILQGLPQRLNAQASWRLVNDGVGGMDLRADFADMTPAIRDALLPHIRHVQMLIASSNDTRLQVSLLVAGDTETPAKLMRAVEASVQQVLAIKRHAKGEWVCTPNFCDFSAIKADAARECLLNRNMSIWRLEMPVTVRIARGHVLLEIVIWKGLLTDAQIADLAETAFARCGEKGL